MDKVKYTFNRDAGNAGEIPYQYMNTPSCDKFGPPWQRRYWGNNYEKLLKIKSFWDPHNVFNHCHSVGSTSNDCCAF